MQEINYIEVVAQTLELQDRQVSTVLNLIDEGATVPFIARYRKEVTGDLDENVIREIVTLRTKEEKLYKAKQTALNGIDEMGKLTQELESLIINAKTLKEVEDIYKPYKAKKKTKAMIAIENGFQIIADKIKTNLSETEIKKTSDFLDLVKNFSAEEILDGSKEIISAEIVINPDLRDFLIESIYENGSIAGKIKGEKSLDKLNDKTKGELHKFKLYEAFDSTIQVIKNYQILALNRGEKLGILNIKVVLDDSEESFISKIISSPTSIYKLSIIDGFKKLYKSVGNEVRGYLSEEAEDEAIVSFQDNLKALLTTKPEYGKSVLAIDPGYRTGCKIALLDDLGNPVFFSKIFIHSEGEAIKKLINIITKYSLDKIVIGNGTGSNETVEILQKALSLSPKEKQYLLEEIFIVNESGASVYSASKTAQEEFPDLDVTDRGTVSIGRRFINPLSELVKIPTESIGVGMYQHDMPVKKLEEKLGYVVEDCVNSVGININSSSVYLLNHVSGINKTLAKKIYKNRPYKSRLQLKKVLSEKAYEQAVGFMRVPESSEKFDNTDIHPDQYELAEYIIKNNINLSNYRDYLDDLKNIYPNTTNTTIDFVISSYENIGKDLRVNFSHQKASKKMDIDSIVEGDMLEGTIRNVVAFGAFVDIGLKNDGLVHISELADQYVSNPADFVTVGQKVKVKIISIDKQKGKIQLSMKKQ